MEMEIPGLSPRDWSITTLEDGTVRVARTEAARRSSFLRNAHWRLKLLALFAGLVWAASYLPAALQGVAWLALAMSAPFLILLLAGLSRLLLRGFACRREWILGDDFMEVRRRLKNDWRVESFQACVVQLVNDSFRGEDSLWVLQLDGESAREQAPPGGIQERLANSVGYVLGTATRYDDADELRALGELIARHTGWSFGVYERSSKQLPEAVLEAATETCR